MTAQARETLVYKGNEHSMITEPLYSYFIQNNKFPHLVPPTTACWRGYYGKWEVREDKLYLIKLVAYTNKYGVVGIDHFFPGKTEVFAEWYTGSIVIPQGKLLRYVHSGYESVYEEELKLLFHNGNFSGDVLYEKGKLAP